MPPVPLPCPGARYEAPLEPPVIDLSKGMSEVDIENLRHVQQLNIVAVTHLAGTHDCASHEIGNGLRRHRFMVW